MCHAAGGLRRGRRLGGLRGGGPAGPPWPPRGPRGRPPRGGARALRNQPPCRASAGVRQGPDPPLHPLRPPREVHRGGAGAEPHQVRAAGDPRAGAHPYPHINNITSFYKSSCANNGKGVHSTPQKPFPFSRRLVLALFSHRRLSRCAPVPSYHSLFFHFFSRDNTVFHFAIVPTTPCRVQFNSIATSTACPRAAGVFQSIPGR